jgi:hypothetical protein
MRSLATMVAAALLAVGTLWAQSDGTPTFGQQKSFGLDTIDLVSLTPELTIPIYSKPGPLPLIAQIEITSSCQVIPYGKAVHRRVRGGRSSSKDRPGELDRPSAEPQQICSMSPCPA